MRQIWSTSMFGVLMTAAIGCVGTKVSDDSLYLTGTEESYVTGSNGEKTCDGHKVLICHIPPGNPANAHTICVDKHAVDPHVSHHGDGVGECAAEPTPPPEDPPPGDPPPGDPPPPPPPDGTGTGPL